MVLQQLKKKYTFLGIQEKGLKIFSWKWLPNLNKKKIFPGEGVFHAAAGTEAEADDLDWWVFFFIWFRLMSFSCAFIANFFTDFVANCDFFIILYIWTYFGGTY